MQSALTASPISSASSSSMQYAYWSWGMRNGIDALTVPIPLPRHKLDAALGGVARQHRAAEVREDAVVAVQPRGLELRCALHRRHVFCDHGSDMDDDLQSILCADAIHVLLSVQHAAPSGDPAEVVASHRTGRC